MTDPRVRKNMLLSALDRAIKQEDEEARHRQEKLYAKQSDDLSQAGSDIWLPENQRHNRVADNANFDKKIYLFPESFNALRRELEENWQEFFIEVNLDVGMSPAYAMVFDAAKFVGMCNGFFDLMIQFDSESVDGICKEILDAARKKRGVSPLH